MRRTFNVVESVGSTDISRNLRVTLIVKNMLPFVSANQKTIGTDPEETDSSVIEYDMAVNMARLNILDDAEVGNALFDPANPDRFTYFAYVSSHGRSSAHLVHDDVDKVIYMIPNLRSLGDVGLIGSDISITAWLVGGYGGSEITDVAGGAGVEEKNLMKIPKPSTNPFITIHTFITGERRGGSTNNNFGFELDSGYLESNTLGLIDFAGLGYSGDIFGVPIPVYRRIEYDFRKYSYVYMGTQDIDDLLIPIPF